MAPYVPVMPPKPGEVTELFCTEPSTRRRINALGIQVTCERVTWIVHYGTHKFDFIGADKHDIHVFIRGLTAGLALDALKEAA